jgi:hypothetical protein
MHQTQSYRYLIGFSMKNLHHAVPVWFYFVEIWPIEW